MPVVYCGLFPTDAEQFEPLREALGRLQLNDAALQFEPEVRTHKHYFALRAFSSVSQRVLVCRLSEWLPTCSHNLAPGLSPLPCYISSFAVNHECPTGPDE